MSRHAKIDAAYRKSIEKAAKRFGDHEGIGEGKILSWLHQFADEDMAVADKILDNVRYYGASNVRGLAHELLQLIKRELRGVPLNRVALVPVGSPGGGADVVARALKEARRQEGGAPLQIIGLRDIEALKQVSAIVFFDDFAGTGDTLEEWWQNIESLVNPKTNRVILALLALVGNARAKLEEFTAAVLAVEEFGDDANVLSSDSNLFASDEKELLIAYCEKTGCGEEMQRGYGRCGLLVAFKHGCPNNSLPVLWYEGRAWGGLFKRRAI